MTIADKLQNALQLHQSGNLADAGLLYQEILREDPDQVDALNLLGVVLSTAGKMDAAITLLSRACELAPDFAGPFVNLGNVLQAMGRLDEAVDAFQKGLTLAPEQAETANNLASALNALGRHEEALNSCTQALAGNPNLGAAHVNMGNALLAMDNAKEAVSSYKKALELNPADSTAHFDLGNAQMKLEKFDAAHGSYTRAVSLDFSNAEKHYNLGNACQALDRFDEAISAYDKAIEINPGYIDAICNRGATLQKMDRVDEAIAALRSALEGEPASPDLHWNLSLALLQNGDYAEGWAEYEWRWQTPTFLAYARDFGAPRWDGEALQGRTLLIDAVQGFGDALQFIRYAALVAAGQDGRIIVECRPQLNRLFSAMPEVDACIDLGAELPAFDLYCPLMSLPHVLGDSVPRVPADAPYVRVPEGVPVDTRITDAAGLKVGLAWAGSPTRVDNHKRSCPIGELAPLTQVPGVTLFSLQVGKHRQDMDDLPDGHGIVDLADDLGDFADTAAAVAALDLVISVDTSVLHLAGALSKSAWGLMSKPTGFLWQTDRTDSPWYPSIKLYRQPQAGNWTDMIGTVAADLAQMAADN
ncbi:MAG: tetratricopeptide repeat protein [Rhodospirillaceae bacterium]|nr:tetratricopeptide repeat protein [Rhodospirillaceae bacterium]